MSDVQVAPDSTRNDRPSAIFRWVALGIFFGLGLFHGIGAILNIYRNPGDFLSKITDHLAIAYGLVPSAYFALGLVVFLQSTSGPISFKGLGFEFSGASGPIVLWLLTFLGFVFGIWLLWDLKN